MHITCSPWLYVRKFEPSTKYVYFDRSYCHVTLHSARLHCISGEAATSLTLNVTPKPTVISSPWPKSNRERRVEFPEPSSRGPPPSLWTLACAVKRYAAADACALAAAAAARAVSAQ